MNKSLSTTEKQFSSVDRKHKITIIINNNIAWFELIDLDQPSYKTFLILMKDVIMYMNNAKITHIQQYIDKEAIEFFSNSTTNQIDDKTWIVSTPIEKFALDMFNALGIKTL